MQSSLLILNCDFEKKELNLLQILSFFTFIAGKPPFGMMPFIETPDGHFIGGSSAITKYICKKAGTVFSNLLLLFVYPQIGKMEKILNTLPFNNTPPNGTCVFICIVV